MFNLCSAKWIERVLDLFHIKKAIRSAYGDAIDLEPVFTILFSEGFNAIFNRLLYLNAIGKLTTQRERQRCFDDFKRQEDESLPLLPRFIKAKKCLPSIIHFSSV